MRVRGPTGVGFRKISMNDEVIVHMCGRIERLRRIMELAHDPKMIVMLEEMIGEMEADIKKLRAGRPDRS